ncbi:EAL domain-containing protein [Massilia yuzhufengensis]|uniref:PAS domain S-box-containing protein/diguanylate cyclase (GGDEF) domain-containing protein n=1 Tax=Massilia yuzhufengensis TaxID=1164594 RepID=A0A1I1PXC4_9BURK|nr:EAL domain-containing protein [Massilia yuzhufengensis]SFD14546.1 PAS domain S-box-containing protein/diguanylate cyclase (GGDEF) domain-containing protein [Massilia yuzhufengensis]
MLRWIAAGCVWRSLFLVLVSGPALAAPAVLRVVADNNYPPYLFIDRDGRAEGYLIDLWALWEKKTGIPVQVRPMEWAAAQQAMRDGRADVIDMLFRTPQRERIYDYSRPYATLDASIYVDRSIAGIHDTHSLSGMIVGVQRGDACIDVLASKGIASLRTYPNYEALLAGGRAEEVEVFCMDDTPASYYMYLHQDRKRFAKAFTLYSGKFHWAVRKGELGTLALVERGMAAITDDEREVLRRKWFSQPAEVTPYLRGLSVAALAVLLLLAVVLAWVHALRRAVRARTAEIEQKTAQLEQAAVALLADQAQLRSLFEGSPDAMALKDRNRVYLHCNSQFENLVGLPRERILGHKDEDLFDDQAFVAMVRPWDDEVLAQGKAFRTDEAVLARDGRSHYLELIKVPIRGLEGKVTGVLVVSRDISSRRDAERELRIASVAFESQDGMMITDGDGTIERVNAAFTRISGFSAEESIGRTPRIVQSGLHEQAFYEEMWRTLTQTGYWIGEIVNRRKDGQVYTARLSITEVADGRGRTLHYIGNLQDISSEKQARALAERLTRFDHLTELPNRTQLAERIAVAVDERADVQEFGAVMMLNLDHFQRINDTLGHGVGDRLLVQVAQRLQAVRREGDLLARFSGDSFVLLCEALGPDRVVAATRAMAVAEAARLAMADQLVLQGHRFACSGSVGVTLFHDDLTGADALLQQAEIAMYKCKRGGRDAVCFFEDAMQRELDDRHRLEGELLGAIETGQLELHYQIQVDRSGRPIGAEALVRWLHPERGMVAPGEFIPLAEESGLILPIGRWALELVCQQLAAWKGQALLEDMVLAVNISPLQFKVDSFVDDILDDVRRTGAPAARLKLEVTESLAIDDFTSSISKLNALKSHGFSISLDDFGTGNSSLNYLTRLPLTQLKIDKSFVDELPSSQADAMLAQTIIAMGKGLGLEVIAEGVETCAQRDFLIAHGCHAFQGYLFGKPVKIAELEAMVRAGAVVAPR